jgi:hypothetical protein
VSSQNRPEQFGLTIGQTVTATDGHIGTVKGEVNEHGNVLIEWTDGFRGWSQARLIRERIRNAEMAAEFPDAPDPEFGGGS